MLLLRCGCNSGCMQMSKRTLDVLGDGGSFAKLLLPDPILRGLQAAGFVQPSPVQEAAIPLGRVGADLVVQAKSGTGKTLVFAVIILDKLKLDVLTPQVCCQSGAQHLTWSLPRAWCGDQSEVAMQSSVNIAHSGMPVMQWHRNPSTGSAGVQALILTPTREISLQVAEVLSRVGQTLLGPPLSVGVFIGGMPVEEDQKLLRRCAALCLLTLMQRKHVRLSASTDGAT